MSDEKPDVRAAKAMRALDEPTRNRLIREAGPKVIDCRHWHRDYQAKFSDDTA